MRQPKKLFISFFILLVIGLHALPLLQKFQDKTQTWWPFMAWGMYKISRNAPARAGVMRTIGVTSRGEAEEISPSNVGLPGPTFTRLYFQPMQQGDASAAQRLAARLNHRREDPIVELRVESETYTITNSGIIKEANPAVIYQVSNR